MKGVKGPRDVYIYIYPISRALVDPNVSYVYPSHPLGRGAIWSDLDDQFPYYLGSDLEPQTLPNHRVVIDETDEHGKSACLMISFFQLGEISSSTQLFVEHKRTTTIPIRQV